MADTVLSRDPQALPDDLPRGGDLPPDLDPLADGILMAHQRAWLDDASPLKVCEKGRRTGITFAEMLDATLCAAASRSAGGMNVFYIGDTKDKGREAIGYVAHFARTVAGELAQVEEFLFEDRQEDGSTKHISAYRVRFASGFRVEALSSNPANIRGLQGRVVIDEAAFHRDVREVIDAVNALLIWGGQVRVISTHNGHLNPFNELVREARAGKSGFSVHRYTFDDAVGNGLYRRVCLMTGRPWTQDDQDAWEARIRDSYGSRVAAMRQELDAVPSEMAGAALTRVQIEAATIEAPFLRWVQNDDFRNAGQAARESAAADWCETHLAPVLDALDPRRRHAIGEDFARSGDATDIVVLETGVDLRRRTRLLVEMRNIPFAQQRQVFFFIADRVPQLVKAALDKTGNGAFLAEEAALRYGATVEEVAFSRGWYEREMPPYIDALTDRTMLLPAHEDVVRDHQALQFDGGVIKVPQDFRFKGSDGLDRHGDSAVAGALAFYASRQPATEFDYRPAPTAAEDQSDGDAPGAWWRRPLGARLRGSLM